MPKPLPFEVQFAAWLDRCLERPVPREVRAFVFGLSRRELACVVELSGTSEFNRASSGWTWSENWSPETAKLTLPHHCGFGHLSECSRLVRQAIVHYLDVGYSARRLTAVEGIAVEILGEGYSLLWTRELSAQERLFG